ncbi:MAG: DUF1566 domain-containing protein [Chromatiales bacterium]|jgi:hypothetical protein
MKIGCAFLFLAALAAGTAEGAGCSDKVRPSAPLGRFEVLHGGATVLDPGAGLEWKRCPEGDSFSDNGTPSDISDDLCLPGAREAFTWQEALQRAEAVNTALGQTTPNGQLGEGGYAGANDWRVPNIKELMSIVEVACYNPATNWVLFPKGFSVELVFWTASPYHDRPSGGVTEGVWVVDFYDGHQPSSGYGKTNSYRVRLVRGGL